MKKLLFSILLRGPSEVLRNQTKNLHLLAPRNAYYIKRKRGVFLKRIIFVQEERFDILLDSIEDF